MKRIIKTSNAPEPIGPYNQAIQAGNFLYVSGQIAIDPSSNALITDSINKETHQVLKNIIAILKEADYTIDDIIKSSIFLSDMDLFAEVNSIYNSYFTSHFPARETVAVKGLPKNVNVEISVIGYKD